MAKKIDVNGLDHFKEKENAMIASEYSSSKTYAVGDYCYHAGVLQCCTTPITTAENWTAGHWATAKLADDCSSLKTAITELDSVISTNENISGILKSNNLLNYAKAETGSFNNNSGANNTDSGYYRTDFIEINPSTNYVFTTIANIANGRYGFWDSSKTFISSATLFSSQKEIAFTTPSNAKYVRFAFNTTITKSFWIGLASESYSPYDYKGEKVFLNAYNNQNDIVRKASKNLFNSNDYHSKYILNWNSQNLRGQVYTDVLSSNNSYLTSKPIPVEYGKTYSSYYGYYQTARNTPRWFVLTNEFVLLESLYDSQTITISNPYAAYVVISDTLSYANEIIIVEGTTALAYYQDRYYFKRIKDDSGYMLTKRFDFGWSGKKICGYGDSITQWGAWLPDVAYWFEFDSYLNYGMSGSQVAYNSEASKWWVDSVTGQVYGSEIDYPESPATNAVLVNYCFCSADRVNNLPEDIDVVLVMGGINDSARNVTIGTYTFGETYDKTTFKGGLAETVKLIQTHLPTAQIVLMTNIFNADKDISPYNTAIKEVANQLGLAVIDVHSCGINAFNADSKLTDGTHPTYNVQNSGAEMIMNRIIDGLKTIRPHYELPYLKY